MLFLKLIFFYSFNKSHTSISGFIFTAQADEMCHLRKCKWISNRWHSTFLWITLSYAWVHQKSAFILSSYVFKFFFCFIWVIYSIFYLSPRMHRSTLFCSQLSHLYLMKTSTISAKMKKKNSIVLTTQYRRLCTTHMHNTSKRLI